MRPRPRRAGYRTATDGLALGRTDWCVADSALRGGALAQLVAIEREAESGVVGRHFDIDQTPCSSGFGARGAELHEQFLACELHRRDLFETRPQPLELAPSHGAFLVDARVALRQQVKLLLLSAWRRMSAWRRKREQFDIDTRAHRLPGQTEQSLLQLG